MYSHIQERSPSSVVRPCDALVVRACSRASSALDTEQVLDVEALADVIHEGITESQRSHEGAPHTSWWDAVAAAELLLFHVVNTASE